jgi:hypothetical protein
MNGVSESKMGILRVQNGYLAIIHGLGKNKPLSQLGQTRVTIAVRKELRSKYGQENVSVSDANYSNDIWSGKCRINDTQYSYQIQ